MTGGIGVERVDEGRWDEVLGGGDEVFGNEFEDACT